MHGKKTVMPDIINLWSIKKKKIVKTEDHKNIRWTGELINWYPFKINHAINKLFFLVFFSSSIDLTVLIIQNIIHKSERLRAKVTDVIEIEFTYIYHLDSIKVNFSNWPCYEIFILMNDSNQMKNNNNKNQSNITFCNAILKVFFVHEL